jgi:hypothetical protein
VPGVTFKKTRPVDLFINLSNYIMTEQICPEPIKAREHKKGVDEFVFNGEFFFDEISGVCIAVAVLHLFHISRVHTGGGLSYNLPGNGRLNFSGPGAGPPFCCRPVYRRVFRL